MYRPDAQHRVHPSLVLEVKRLETPCLGKQAGAAGLDRVNLGLSPGYTVESRGQLAAVEELAPGWLNRTQGLPRMSSNEASAGGE